MKRSSQVALVVMGVAATTAAGAYLLPSRADCRVQAAPQQPTPPRLGVGDAPAVPAAQPQPAQADQNCRRRSRGWSWYSGSRNRDWTSTQRTTSPSTAFTRTTTTSRTTTSPTTTRPSTSSPSSTPRSGFGTTSRSISSSPSS